MNSKEFVQRSGLAISTVRYYEKIGLLPAPERGKNNYRSYEERHLVLVEFIKQLRLAGFSIRDIKRFLNGLKEQGNLTDYAQHQIRERLLQIYPANQRPAPTTSNLVSLNESR